MKSFPLRIYTPDGVQFEGSAHQLVVRTDDGDVGVLAGHINFVAPLGMGKATVVTQDSTRYAACMGGMICVLDGEVTLLPTTFEWADSIDADRAERARHRAQTVLDGKDATDAQILLAQARLKRALVRKSVSSYK